jgi:hypothetical protein
MSDDAPEQLAEVVQPHSHDNPGVLLPQLLPDAIETEESPRSKVRTARLSDVAYSSCCSSLRAKPALPAS